MLHYTLRTASHSRETLYESQFNFKSEYMKKNLLDLLTSLLLGIGSLTLVSPIFFYWWIHGNYEHYIWIIRGPAPYSSFGGGPYQLFNFFIVPILLGGVIIAISIIMKQKLCK